MAFRRINTGYVYRTMPNGTIGMWVFDMDKVDPKKDIFDQPEACVFADNQNFFEALVNFSSAIIAAAEAGSSYAQQVRMSKIRTMADQMKVQPADPFELAKLAAYFEGANLDPAAQSVSEIQQALQPKDGEEQQGAD